MKAILLRTAIFAAIIAGAYTWLWIPFHAGSATLVRLNEFILCVAIQTSVPLVVWIAFCLRPNRRVTQACVTLFWTWLVSSALVLLAESHHDSSVYRAPRPWDYLLREGGIMIYLPLLAPVFSIVAAGLTLIPDPRRAHK